MPNIQIEDLGKHVERALYRIGEPFPATVVMAEIVAVGHKGRMILVLRDDDVYHVTVDGLLRHPNLDAHGGMRALASYLEDGSTLRD